MAEIGNVTVRVDAVITDEQYREAMGAVRAANERMDLLKAENDNLREEIAKWERLAAGIDLPEYPVTQFKPKDLERENAKLLESNKKWMGKAARFEEKNAKLRELVRIAIEYCVNGYCAEEDECPLYESRHSCNLYAKARELGVEVE